MDYYQSMNGSLPIVVFITHHANDMLWDALRSLLLSKEWTREIWVVHSNESETSIPTEFADSVYYHWLGDNLGFAAAVNWTFDRFNGPIFIVNDDTKFTDSCLESLHKASLRFPGSILQPEIHLYAAPDTIENAGHHIGIDGNNTAYGRGKTSNGNGISERLCFSGAAFWIPEIIYKHPKLATMDCALSPFGEDLDYALRCVRYGFTIHCIHSAVILHRWGGSYTRFSPQKVTWVESHRIQSKFRNLPLWMCFAAPLSSLFRYGKGLQDARIPSGKSTSAARASLQGIYEGYIALPAALSKRRQEEFVVSDWEFTKLWWKQR